MTISKVEIAVLDLTLVSMFFKIGGACSMHGKR
jgi:hypothetical protein